MESEKERGKKLLKFVARPKHEVWVIPAEGKSWLHEINFVRLYNSRINK